ncbi:MAG: FHA domain-containing protein [Planctomycetaceae bacterium]
MNAPENAVEAPVSKVCGTCGKIYPAEFQDEFCECGAELTAGILNPSTSPGSPPDSANSQPDVPSAPQTPPKPKSGSKCLVTYSVDRLPIHHFVIDKDVTVIGRNDPIRNIFVDLDFSEILEPDMARKISRRHATILRSREDMSLVLRPTEGNTGTQVEGAIAEAGLDYPLTDGTRIILGGVARIKFEVIL